MEDRVMCSVPATVIYSMTASLLILVLCSAAESKSSESTNQSDQKIQSKGPDDKAAIAADDKKQDDDKEEALAKETTGKEGKPKNKLLSRQAKVNIGRAERTALKEVPGETEEIELEIENGKLVYSIDIKGVDGTREVTIDAKTGEIIKVEKDDDAKTVKTNGG
jgi:uncharacterized membrane protein YkoI